MSGFYLHFLIPPHYQFHQTYVFPIKNWINFLARHRNTQSCLNCKLHVTGPIVEFWNLKSLGIEGWKMKVGSFRLFLWKTCVYCSIFSFLFKGASNHSSSYSLPLMMYITTALAAYMAFCAFTWDNRALLGCGQLKINWSCMPHAWHVFGLDDNGSYGLDRSKPGLACILGAQKQTSALSRILESTIFHNCRTQSSLYSTLAVLRFLCITSKAHRSRFMPQVCIIDLTDSQCIPFPWLDVIGITEGKSRRQFWINQCHVLPS